MKGGHITLPGVVENEGGKFKRETGIALDTLREPAAAIAREHLRGVTALTRLLLDKGSVASPAAWPGILLF